MSLEKTAQTITIDPSELGPPPVASPNLAADMRLLIGAFKRYTPLFQHVAVLLDIHEGNLLKYIEEDLVQQLSPQSYAQCKWRLAPINLMNKIVEKTSKIYQPAPARRLIGGTDQDVARFEQYCEWFDVNTLMRDAAEMLTLNKSMLVQPYANKGKAKARVVQNDHFFAVSTDEVDPLEPTHITTFRPGKKGDGGSEFTAYTDADILIFNEKEEVDTAAMAALNNPMGVNPFGRVPFVYKSQSKKKLMPQPDSDVLRMTKLIPILFSDLNYAAMFQAFSIMYGINVDEENLKISPNAFWRFKQDKTTDAKPEVGILRPTVDIDQVLSLIETQLSLWLNSRGIRPGSVGKLTKDNFASGISKMIDEMDTVELRQTLVDEMTCVEEEFWDLVMFSMHPVWLRNGELGAIAGEFSPGCEVEVVFNTQLPVISRGQLVADLSAERAAGFVDQETCIRKLNPLMADDEIAALIVKIKADTPAPSAADVSGAGADASALEQEGAGKALEATA